MQENHVVTCFLEYDGRILLLRRSRQVGTYQQRWAGISGYIDENHTPIEQALIELLEETGLGDDDVRLVLEGASVNVADEALARIWIVHPFRFQIDNPDLVRLDWEHTACVWIYPSEMNQYETVPGLDQAWETVR